MPYLPSEELPIAELFEHMRKAARSHDAVERIRTLWVGAQMGERLERCSDHQIGELVSMVQNGIGIFTPDFVVCEEAMRRLLKSSARSPNRYWRVICDAGVELLNAEAALYQAGIPHLLLPFQRDRFASNVFYVQSAAEARACLLRQGFLRVAGSETALLDSETNHEIRLVEGEQKKMGGA